MQWPFHFCINNLLYVCANYYFIIFNFIGMKWYEAKETQQLQNSFAGDETFFSLDSDPTLAGPYFEKGLIRRQIDFNLFHGRCGHRCRNKPCSCKSCDLYNFTLRGLPHLRGAIIDYSPSKRDEITGFPPYLLSCFECTTSQHSIIS